VPKSDGSKDWFKGLFSPVQKHGKW
jgi:hypothetical protein